MPVAIVAIAAVAAGAATTAAVAGAVVAGITIGATVAAVIGSVVASVVMFAGTALLGGKKGSAPASAAEDRKQMVRGTVEPRQVIYGQARVSGAMVYVASTGDKKEFLHMVVVLAGHPVQAIETVWINETEIAVSGLDDDGMVTTGDLSGLVRIRLHLGDQTEADPVLVAESTDGWSADHRLLGCTYLYARMEYNRDKFPSGLSNISARVHGKKLLDPRTAAVTYSANWALVILDFLRGEHGFACKDDELDLPSFVAAANLSDEQVQLDADATSFHARYDVCGTYQQDRAPIEVLEELLACGGGTLVYVQGRYRLYGGAYGMPTDTLGVDDFAGPIELQTRPPRRDLFNAVRGTFVDPTRNWQEVEYPPLIDAGFEEQDGERIWRDMELPWVIDPVRCQRLAKMTLRIARETLSFKVPVRYAGIRYAVWQTLSVTVPDFGWNAKAFRVTAWSFDPPTGQVVLTLREEGLGSYAWLYDEGADQGPVSDTDLINPLAIPAPTNLIVVATSAINADGAAVPAIEVSWTAAAHAFVTGHEVQWRVQGGPWQAAEVPMPGTRYVISPVVVGQAVDIRVRAIGGLVRGAWSALLTTTGQPDTTPPAIPTGLAATGVIRGIALRWINPTDRDFAKIEIQERANRAGSTWATVGSVDGTTFLRSGLLPVDKLRYRIRALDRSGNASGWTAEIEAQPSLALVDDIADGILTTAKFAAGLTLPELVDSLPTAGNFDGRLAVVKGERKIYQFRNGVWEALVGDLSPDAKITSAQIDKLAWAKLDGAMPQATQEQIQLANTKGELLGSRLTAGSVDTERLRVGASTNVIWNAVCDTTMDGWVGAVTPGRALLAFQPVTGTAWDPNWRLAGSGSGMIRAANIVRGTEMIAVWHGQNGAMTPAQAGQYWVAQARVSPSGCNARVRLQFMDGGRNFISEFTTIDVPPVPQGRGIYLDDYHQCWCKGVAPPGTAFVRMIVGTGDPGAGSWPDAYIFWSQALLGLANPNQAEPSVFQPGGMVEVGGGMVRANTIGARHIIAGDVTAEKLAVGSGTNDLWNACCWGTTDGWTMVAGATNPGNQWQGSARLEARPTGDQYQLLGLGTGVLRLANGRGLWGGDELNACWFPGGSNLGLAVVPGQRYHGAALLNTHRCTGRVQIVWLRGQDGNGNWQVGGTSDGTVVNRAIGFGSNDIHYVRSTVIGTAPADCPWAVFRVQMLPLAAEAEPHLFFTKAMFGASPPNASVVPDWTAGGVTQISGGNIRTNSMEADRIRAKSIKALQVDADEMRAAVMSVGAMRADEIAVGALRARHMASETIISQSVQLGTAVVGEAEIGNLTVGTLKLRDGAISGWSATRTNGGQGVPRPGGGWTKSRYAALTIRVEGQRNVLILHQQYGLSVNMRYPDGQTGGGNPGTGGESGGGSGE